MLIMFKMKLVAALLGLSVSAVRVDMVSRVRADVYSVPGEGEIPTLGCTITANRMTAELDPDRGKPFIVFYDANSEEEGRCQIDIRVSRNSY